MRRLIALLTALALTLSLVGCMAASQAEARAENSYALYFREKDLSTVRGGDAIRTESIQLDGSEEMGTQQLAEALLSRLLSGPTDETLENPIPEGTQMLSCMIRGARAMVDFSSAYGTLSGVALTLADYCTTLTLTQIPGISSVSITVRGQQLAYRDKQTFTRSDALLTSLEDVVARLDVKLYFLDTSGALTAEPRKLELYEGDSSVKVLLAALQAGPQDETLRSALPEGFSVQSIWSEDDTCYVNLPSSAESSLPDGEAVTAALTALAESLGSLENIHQVHYLVDGEAAERYAGAAIGEDFLPEAAG